MEFGCQQSSEKHKGKRVKKGEKRNCHPDNKLELSKAYLLPTSLRHKDSETTPSLLVSKKNKEQRKNANRGTFSSLMLFTRPEHHLGGKSTLSPLCGVQDLNYRCKLTRKFWNIACPFKLSFINILQAHS